MTTPNLGPLAQFTGTYGGPTNSSGLSSIFRPQSPQTPTAGMPAGALNVLQLTVVREVLMFTSNPGLIGVPVNRGSIQGDITLVPIIYSHYVEDQAIPETLSNLSTGAGVIHEEVGMFLVTPATTAPAEPVTICRGGFLPHGVSFAMQGPAVTIQGPPTIPPMNCSDSATPTGITPFITGSHPPALVPQPSLTVTNKGTARLPQDLTSMVAAGNISQAILNDPNTILRNVTAKQNITSTTIITLDTHGPIPGGGVTNTAFLLSNATCTRARSTFYIEMVNLGLLGTWPQIQYTQEILLDFDGITYPHMTVATLTRDPFPPILPFGLKK